MLIGWISQRAFISSKATRIDTCGTQLSQKIKGAIFPMIYLGIDVAKSSHVAAALSSDGEVVLTPFTFSNSSTGFSILQEKLSGLQTQPLLIGLESTAHYGENLIHFLCGAGYHVAMINPLQTAAIRKSRFERQKRIRWTLS